MIKGGSGRIEKTFLAVKAICYLFLMKFFWVFIFFLIKVLKFEAEAVYFLKFVFGFLSGVFYLFVFLFNFYLIANSRSDTRIPMPNAYTQFLLDTDTRFFVQSSSTQFLC